MVTVAMVIFALFVEHQMAALSGKRTAKNLSTVIHRMRVTPRKEVALKNIQKMTFYFMPTCCVLVPTHFSNVQSIDQIGMCAIFKNKERIHAFQMSSHVNFSNEDASLVSKKPAFFYLKFSPEVGWCLI